MRWCLKTTSSDFTTLAIPNYLSMVVLFQTLKTPIRFKPAPTCPSFKQCWSFASSSSSTRCSFKTSSVATCRVPCLTWSLAAPPRTRLSILFIAAARPLLTLPGPIRQPSCNSIYNRHLRMLNRHLSRAWSSDLSQWLQQPPFNSQQLSTTWSRSLAKPTNTPNPLRCRSLLTNKHSLSKIFKRWPPLLMLH